MSPSKDSTPKEPEVPSDGLPPLSPDAGEQGDSSEALDNIVPTRGYQMMPMVGLGGSAGGIQALVTFFGAMPPDSGIVFVVILHLSPHHESTLAALLGRVTSMPVVQAQDGEVHPNHVYVIPPGKYLRVMEEHLELIDLESERGRRTSVDMFFRSLADSHGPHGTAVVLSGLDGDGALGIKRVKERGGLTIAQDPDEAEHPGMPQSAIDTGMVDWVLRAAEMPGRLLGYLQHEQKLHLPPEELPTPPAQSLMSDEGEAALREVLAFLRTRTGRDFACYKRATILRRVARRMQVNAVEDLPGYATYLRTHPGESGALLQDLLISVTNFFRDREAFEALQRLLPRLFEGKTQGDQIRIWVPACATGEEAYSLAMLLLEHARKLDNPPALQVFACDLNEEAISKARIGFFTDTIAADVSEERLRLFFVKEEGGYRVRRDLREMVLFATHDLLKDAPFSRMDMISCRNLLIYLNRDAQGRVFEIFHFAMKSEALLFLGSSETIEDNGPLFRILDKKYRIYAHQVSPRANLSLPMGSSAMLRALQAHAKTQTVPVMHGRGFTRDGPAPFPTRLTGELDRTALAELHFNLVERYAPPSVIVNAEHEVMHLSEHVGDFFKFVGGEPTLNLMRVVHPMLRVELRAALFRAAEADTPIDVLGVRAEIDGKTQLVDLHVFPAGELAPGFLLVIFEARRVASPPESVMRAAGDSVGHHLERELSQVKEQLRDTIEQYEASTEELKASNEELQAMNEELRSATEELETSREELQSINEELSTVNSEMKSKVDEIAHANSDLQNLMASTAIATVFLDRAMTIMRYTPSAASIFNIIPGDIGRPLGHLKHKLDDANLLHDAEQVLRTLVPIEREVTDERWFLSRLQPYRTLEDHIGGIVVTLVDVTERNRASEALRLSEERMRLLIESAKDYAIFTFDPQRRINSWNTGAQATFGYTGSDILGQSADILFTPEDQQKGAPEHEIDRARDEGRAENERWHMRKDGTLLYGSGSVMALRDKRGELVGFVKIMRDLTESKRAQEALSAHMEELTRFNLAAVGREIRMIELKKEVNELCKRLGEKAHYSIEPEDSQWKEDL